MAKLFETPLSFQLNGPEIPESKTDHSYHPKCLENEAPTQKIAALVLRTYSSLSPLSPSCILPFYLTIGRMFAPSKILNANGIFCFIAGNRDG